MKLIRFGERGAEKPGVLVGAERKDCSAHFADWNVAFFRDGGLARLRTLLERGAAALPTVAESVRWGSPIARPGKVVCIGLNYGDHAEESGAPIPKEPVVFLKAPNTLNGPYDQIDIPRGSTKTDWEVELGVVLARDARYLADEAAASAVIAGFCVSNDVSERAFQHERGGQWTKGKSCDTFLPLGPYLATPEEIPNLQNLAMTTDVSGERMQNGTTRTMLFGVNFLLYHLSHFMTLEAGDLLSTGTPAGVGAGKKPPRYLRAGDVVEAAIEGLGRQRLTCRNAS